MKRYGEVHWQTLKKLSGGGDLPHVAHTIAIMQISERNWQAVTGDS